MYDIGTILIALAFCVRETFLCTVEIGLSLCTVEDTLSPLESARLWHNYVSGRCGRLEQDVDGLDD